MTFLDKATVIQGNEDLLADKQANPWRLATVTKVEATKLVINIIPIWLTSLTFGLCMAQTSTFFVKQSSTINRNIGNNFVIPPVSIHILSAIGMIICVTAYEKIFVPTLKNATGNEQGIRILQRIDIGMVFPVIAMVIAALVERKRLREVKREIVRVERVDYLSMSVFWLAT
ncbi:unnamed protein product [Camellia sinensis]